MSSKSSSRTLTDHEEIRRWAEDRGAKPAAVRNTGSEGEDVGIIRLDFPGYSGSGSLEEISWDQWFDNFDDNELALVVQDKMANGQKSNFNKLVSRDSVAESSEGEAEDSSTADRSKGRMSGGVGTKRGTKKTSRTSNTAEREPGQQSASRKRKSSKKKAA